MRKLIWLPLFMMMFLSLACDVLKESEIRGTLVINPKGGYPELELLDQSTNTRFKLGNGVYKFEFERWRLPYTDPRIRIINDKGQIVGKMTVPLKSVRDDGTFAVTMNDPTNRNSYNILGGRRVITLSRERFAKQGVSCTYTETYPCTTTDAKGNKVSSTCTRSVQGEQDELWEKRKEKTFYRILFDGGDLVNVADFSGESKIREETEMLKATSCQ